MNKSVEDSAVKNRIQNLCVWLTDIFLLAPVLIVMKGIGVIWRRLFFLSISLRGVRTGTIYSNFCGFSRRK